MSRIGLVQGESCACISTNLGGMEAFAAAAARDGCEAVCFPECFLTGYAPENAHSLAISRDAACLDQVSRIAKACKVDILTGFMEKAEDAYYITHGIFRQDGSASYYRKTHLGEREKNFFTAGDALEVFSLTNGMRIGICVCVETHYPEITQTLALRGAQVVFAPHAVPRASGDRRRIWGKYIPARSYDNRIYMACCNLWSKERFGGGCLVTGPRGETVAACFQEEPALLSWEMDPELIASFRNGQCKRSRHFYPGLRRKELYE